MTQKFTYQSPIGQMLIVIEDEKVLEISFADHEIPINDFETNLSKQVVIQLNEYFAGDRHHFELPIHPNGTEFQQKVWRKLVEIPFGTSISYSELSKQLGDQNLVRAIGGANSKNPIAIIVPCHRVVGTNKKLVGYAGGLWRKKWLLIHESTNSPSKETLF